MRISGTDQLKRALGALARGDFDSALDEPAEYGLKSMKQVTPVDTGELRDSEHIEKPAKNQRDWVADAPHAIYVEMGTSRMAAQPFMRNTVYGKASQILNRVNKGVQEIIGRMVS